MHVIMERVGGGGGGGGGGESLKCMHVALLHIVDGGSSLRATH